MAPGDLLGRRPLLLAPVDYDCDNICGITLGGLLAALEGLEWRPGEDYDLLVASIDPAATAADAAAARADQRAARAGGPADQARHDLPGRSGSQSCSASASATI